MINNIKNYVDYDAQVLHEAWNQSDKDWLSVLLYINKEYFKKV